MCVVSNVGDWGRDSLPKKFPDIWPDNVQIYPHIVGPSQREFDELRREVEKIKDMLKKAKELDEAMGLPDCKMDEKLEFLRNAAKLVGVDLDEVFKK